MECTKNNLEYFKLGATLYIPATNDDLLKIVTGEKYPNLKSIVIDTEDSVAEENLEIGYHNIKKIVDVLLYIDKDKYSNIPLIFIRTRNLKEFEKLKQIEHISEIIDGVVFPKVNLENLKKYLKDYNFKYFMPIFEDSRIKKQELIEILDLFKKDCFYKKILSIRIGATDILSNFSLRRTTKNIIYDFAQVSNFIAKMVEIFHEFNITAPVFESFKEEDLRLLEQEVDKDLLNGLFGKTIIHPKQIDIVQEKYKVDLEDYEIAKELLNPYAKPVFKLHNRMNEKTTHTNWAKTIIQRKEVFGIKEPEFIFLG